MVTDSPEEQAISKEDAYNFAKDLIDNVIKQYAKDVNLCKIFL